MIELRSRWMRLALPSLCFVLAACADTLQGPETTSDVRPSLSLDPADEPLTVGVFGPSLVSSDWPDPYDAVYSVTGVSGGRTPQYVFYWYVSHCSGPTDLYCWTEHPFEFYASGVELRSITFPIDHYLKVVRVYVESREYSEPNYRSGISSTVRTRAPGFSTGGSGGTISSSCLGGTIFNWSDPGETSRPYKRDYCTGEKVWQ